MARVLLYFSDWDTGLLERGIIPSDVHHGHFTQKQGPKLLADWDLLRRLLPLTAPVVTHLKDFGDVPLIGREEPWSCSDTLFVPHFVHHFSRRFPKALGKKIGTRQTKDAHETN